MTGPSRVINHVPQQLRAFEKTCKFALVVALTKTAKQAKEAAVAAAKATFDAPTPYTLRSSFFLPATLDKPSSTVGFREFAGKGTPAPKYLHPQVFGGQRHAKRFERALRAAGVLPPGLFAVPGEEAELDTYGNMSRGQIVKILSHLRVTSDATQHRSRTVKSRGKRRAQTYFAVLPDSDKAHGLPPGVYRRDNADPRPVLIFTKAPQYSPIYPFYDIVKQSVQEKIFKHFKEALRKYGPGNGRKSGL